MTEQTVSKVPKIRFKGFQGEWDEKALGDLFSITSAARVHKNEWTNLGVPFFRSSDVVSHFKGNENTKAFISHELYEELSAKVGRIKKGDMLVTGGGSIGIPYLVKTDEPLYFKDADLLWFKIREAVDSNYLYTFLTSEPFRRFLRSTSHIGTIAHYTVEQAKSTPLRLPKTAPEQTQIGGYFQALDSLIGLHQRKHDKLVTLKKAMLQKMFPQAGATTPEIRFKGFEGEWVEKKLGDLTETGFTNGVFNDPSKVGRGYRLINVKDMFSGIGIDVDNLSLVDLDENEFKKNKVQYGDIFFTRSSLVKEGIACSNVNLSAHQDITFDGHLIRMQPCRKITDSIFLSYAFMTASSRRQFILGGKTTTMTTIGQSDIAVVEVALPTKTEQIQIGTYFRQLDALISKHTIQLQKLKQLKSACLEKMFV